MKKSLLISALLLSSIALTSCGDNSFEKTNSTFESTIIENIDSTSTNLNQSSSLDNSNKYKTAMNNFIDNLINQTNSYVPAWNKEGFKGRWNYIDGVFLNSISNLYETYLKTDKNKAYEYKNFMINYVNYYVSSTGEFNYLGSPNQDGSIPSAFNENELDTICESKVLFDCYNLTNDQRYQTAINYTYDKLVKLPRVEGANNFWHKVSYPNQIWLDGMYMYGPFYAEYASVNNNPSILTELKEQYQYINEHMRDSNTGLFYHGYDSTKKIFWANTSTGCSKNFWLRSMGWFTVSLTDVIEYYPKGEERTYLLNLYKNTIDSILKYQDTDSKMFYQLVDLGPSSYTVPASYLKALKNTKYATYNASKNTYSYKDTTISNYLESSGSSMIAYAILKGYNKGYLDSKYKTIGKEIFEGVFNHSFSNNELNDICITAGLGPESNTTRDGSIAYYLAEKVGSNDAKGVGPFIMAYTEYLNLK